MFIGKAISVVLIALSLPASCQNTRAGRDETTPSGFAVPRYLTLRFGEINARAGPSEDHAKLWTYHAQGMPVQVIAETKDWRRICDPEGGISWVAARMLEGGDAAVIRMKPGPLPVHRDPSPTSAMVASLPPRAVAVMDECKAGWCKIRVGKAKGWAPAAELWGTNPAPQCAGLAAPVVAEPAP
jgi:SH3-like domain-containing protein